MKKRIKLYLLCLVKNDRSIINKVTPNEYKIEYNPEVVPGFQKTE